MTLPADSPAGDGLHGRFQALHGAPEAAASMARRLGNHARHHGKRVVAVSGCLLGEPVRYDGGHKHAPEALADLMADPSVVILPLCPEMLAGMGCPRPAVHFAAGDGGTLADGRGGRIVDVTGQDRTAEMVHGAERAVALCRTAGVTAAVLKENSPSCGIRDIHGPLGRQPGQGGFAARLARDGIALRNEAGHTPT